MEPQCLSLIDVGVDYFTSTCSDQKRAGIVHDKAAILIMQEHAAGNEKKVWKSYGYEGFHCGGVDVGSRHDGTIVRLSGPTAYLHWQKFFKLASNVSRLDLQATLRWSEPSPRMIAKHFRASMRLHKLGKVKRTITMLRSSDGSATIYYGKRESERFGRIYQKDVESKLDHYSNALRYEIELKGDLAHRTAASIHNRSSLKDMCYSQVRTYYGDAGVRMPLFSDRQFALTCASRTLTDNESRRRWLISSVKPAVKQLLANGDLSIVLESLGLSEYVYSKAELDHQTFTSQKEELVS